MPAIDPIKIVGLREVQAELRAAGNEIPRQLRLVLNTAADLVASTARRSMPTRTGAAAGSIKTVSSQREARVAGGSRKAPYYPWLDYGGRVGRDRSVQRPYRKEGRYLYPAYARRRGEVEAALQAGLVEVCKGAGLEVD